MNTTQLLEKWIDGGVLTTKELVKLSADLNEIINALIGKGAFFKPTCNFVIQYRDSINNCLQARLEKA